MAILKIARMGHPILRQVAAPVADPTTPKMRRLVADMWETLDDIDGAGLAAPQVHASVRLVIFRLPPERCRNHPEDTIPPTVLFNPELEPLDDQMITGVEGCLSLPHLRGMVPRFRTVRYKGIDAKGRTLVREVTGYHARVVQHETDHLDGILYPERMTSTRLLCYEDQWKRFVSAQDTRDAQNTQDTQGTQEG